MPGERTTASYLDHRRDARFAAPRSFVLVDPCRPTDTLQWGPGVVDALIVDVLGCAARHGTKAALDAAAALLLDVREHLDAQVWLRIQPAADGVTTSFADLVGRADGVVLPAVRSTAEVEEALALLGDATPLMPVVDGDAVHRDVERLAGHPAVVRFAARSRTHRVNLPLVSQVYGLPGPVNGVGAEATDACELMHDAVVARCAGYGGQCVPRRRTGRRRPRPLPGRRPGLRGLMPDSVRPPPPPTRCRDLAAMTEPRAVLTRSTGRRRREGRRSG
ncbi:hypothetical protein [Streptomyces sp. NPDC001927]